jgi:hypothetical protein
MGLHSTSWRRDCPVQHGCGTATGRITKLPRYLSRLVNEPKKDNSTAMGATTVATNSEPPLSYPAMRPRQSRGNEDGGESGHAGELTQIESFQPCGWPAAVAVSKRPAGRLPTSSAEPPAYHGIAPPNAVRTAGYWHDPG